MKSPYVNTEKKAIIQYGIKSIIKKFLAMTQSAKKSNQRPICHMYIAKHKQT